MAGYATGSDELVQCGKDIMTTSESVLRQLSSLANVIDSVESAWKGDAKKAFDTLMERYQTEAKDLQQALEAIAEQMAGTADAYIQQEQEQNEAMSNITKRLG